MKREASEIGLLIGLYNAHSILNFINTQIYRVLQTLFKIFTKYV
jgi:hypothetical protein